MKYQVVIEKPAREEIDKAYYWGCEKWGSQTSSKMV